MRSDPSDTGGLFVGRRPGTAPVHYRAVPERGSAARQRVDRRLADAMLAMMTVLSLCCWGPIPIACLWIGAQVNYLSGSVSLGILSSFVGLLVLLFGALKIMRNLDEAWILVRRAAGIDQRSGALGRVFAITAAICAGGVRDLVCAVQRHRQHGHPLRRRPLSPVDPPADPASQSPDELASRAAAAMGLLDYYRQFEGVPEEEVNRGLREEAAERRRKALDARHHARPLADDVAGTAAREHRQRDHLHRARAGCSATPTCAARGCAASWPSATTSRRGA